MGSALCTGLVHRLEDEVLIVVLESIGNLRPELYEAWLHLVVGSPQIAAVDPVLVVEVEDNVHIVADTVVHYLLDPCHPLRIHIILAVKVIVPCCGNSYSVEALCLYGVYHCFCGLRVAPAGLGCQTCGKSAV